MASPPAVSSVVNSLSSDRASNMTRGSLKPARIVKVNKDGKLEEGEGNVVPCMFNPYEYQISKSNQFSELGAAKPKNAPKTELVKPGPQTLSLKLFFDTYEETDQNKRDVSITTNKLWKFMEVENAKQSSDPKAKGEVPHVAFQWGVFLFVSYLTKMTQTFTLFTKDGTPVRAKVDVTFTQYVDSNDYPNQNPTSGSDSVSRVWQVVAGDRLDLIANDVYQDPTKWRLIADYNHITDPQGIQPGQLLTIPFGQGIN